MKFSLLMTLLLSLTINLLYADERCEVVLFNDKDNYESWGSDVDVAYKEDIQFYLNTKTSKKDLALTVNEYGDFECYVDLEKINSQCLIVSVSWSTGGDSSGCYLNLKDNKQDFGESQVYMSY